MFYFSWCLNFNNLIFSVISCLLEQTSTTQRVFTPLFDSLDMCVSGVNRAIFKQSKINYSGFICSLQPQDDFTKTIFVGKIKAFKLVIRLNEVEQTILRKTFSLMDQISTFHQTAYHSNYNTGNLVYNTASSKKRITFVLLRLGQKTLQHRILFLAPRQQATTFMGFIKRGMAAHATMRRTHSPLLTFVGHTLQNIRRKS